MSRGAVTTDIDIDFADREQALEGLMHIRASMHASGNSVDAMQEKNRRHPSGVYFQDVPVDPFTGFCAVPYKDAAELGYFKIDFLNNSLYNDVRDEDHLDELVNKEPDWKLLEHRELVALMVHIGEHFGVVQSIKPTSVEDLAVVLALMRPGKRHLLGKNRAEIDAEIWKTEGAAFQFKRAHALAYAVSIVVQMNLLCEQTAAEMEIDAIFEP